MAEAVSKFTPPSNVLHRRLMAPRLLCLLEELWCALLCHPTLSRRWDVGPHGANIAEEGPQHLLCVDPGH
jgi:hypothetical protein